MIPELQIINEVISDLKLQQSGVKLIYAVDPFEIVDFCFPIMPGESKTRDLSVIADDQAALYEVFFLQPPPVLLTEYAEEMERIVSFLNYELGHAYTKAQLVGEMIRQDDRRNKTMHDDATAKDFNITLAVVMGIYKLGVERFIEVQNRLTSLTLGKLGPIVRHISQSYQESYLVDIIYDQTLNFLGKKRLTKSVLQKKKQPARDDARVIDKLIFLNNELEKAFLSHQIDERCIFLYLSSADRTRVIFELDKIRENLPIIDGKRHSFYRTRTHIFTYVVHKGRSLESNASITEMIKKLEKTGEILRSDRLRQINKRLSSRDDCKKCILEGGEFDNCRWLDTCRKVQSIENLFHDQKLRMQNLGLAASIKNYKQLLDGKPERLDEERYFDAFTKIYQDGTIGDLALQKVRDLQRLMRAQIGFQQFLTDTITIAIERPFLRGMDTVTGIDQYMPVKPEVLSKEYTAILYLLVNYFRTYDSLSRSGNLEAAFDYFLNLELRTKELTGEHELVRCYLYLTHPEGEGDHLAYEHAKEMLALHKQLEQEFLYVLCWCARRLKKFDESLQLGTKAIHSYPQDARFYHGRCLTYFAWLNDAQEIEILQPTVVEEYLGTAIQDAQRAIDLYSLSDKTNENVIGANYNNLAYLYAFQPESCCYDLIKSRRALTSLKKIINKDIWYKQHPEYLHTEAHLEYHEYLEGRRGGKDKDYLNKKLANARREIDLALSILQKELYKQLKDDIEKAFDEISD